MVRTAKITIRTRHISCVYCIALSFLILAIVLFGLSSEQSKALGNQKSRTSVIICASVILVLSVGIFIWITYYAIGYFRLKNHQQMNRSKNETSQISRSNMSAYVFHNQAFRKDESLEIDRSPNIQNSVG